MAQVWRTARDDGDPDAALVAAMARGESAALDALYQRHGPALLAYLVGQLGERQRAEEILQDVMLAAWQGASRFRGESQVRTWLLAIARHHALNARRGRALPTGPLPPDLASVPLPDDLGEALRAALNDLPGEQREALELVFFHGLSGAEAARVQRVAVGTIKSRLHRAKALLRAVLRKEAGDA